MSFGGLQPRLNLVEIGFWRGYALRRFLLETVEHIDAFPELHHVDGAVRVAAPILRDLKNARRAEALEGFRLLKLHTGLTLIKSKPKKILHFIRHRQEVFLQPPTQISGLITGTLFMAAYTYIGIIRNMWDSSSHSAWCNILPFPGKTVPIFGIVLLPPPR